MWGSSSGVENETNACYQTCLSRPVGEKNFDSPEDERFFWSSAMLFLMLWLYIAYWLLRILLKERRRYLERRSKQCGTFLTYLQYRFGHWYAWQHGSSFAVLVLMSATLMVFGGVSHSFLAATPVSESLWSAWVWIAAPDGGNSAQPGGYIVGIVVSMGGMLIFAMLVSLITSGFEEQLWHLRHGSIPVVEGNHIVILGFSRMALILIEELCLAMESTGGGFIVVLAPDPKPEVEQQIREAIKDPGKSHIVVRSGYPYIREDLQRVAIGAARRILVLAPVDVSREEADSRTLNTLLTLHSMSFSEDACVIVECLLVRNQRLFNSLAKAKMETLAVQDFVGQLMVESSRQRGLSSVISQVLGFDGDEFYIASVEDIDGWTFGELMFAFPSVVPVGVISENHESGEQTVTILPPMDLVLKSEDQLVFLSEDISTLPKAVARSHLEAKTVRYEASGSLKAKNLPVITSPHGQELVVILGWNQAIDSIIIDLDRIVEHGSKVLVYSDMPISEREEFIASAQKRRKYNLRRVAVEHRLGSLGARFKLDELPLEKAHKIFILAESTCRSESEADGRTIAAILQVLDILRERNSDEIAVSDMVIIPQVLSKDAEEACMNNGLQDCINSNRLSARVMASACQSPELGAVYSELLSETGARFSIRKISEYLEQGIETDELQVSFADVTAAAMACGEIVIGWSDVPDAADSEGQSTRWVLNPKDKLTARHWTSGDMLVVIGSYCVRNPRSLLQQAVTGSLMPKLRISRALRSQISNDSLHSSHGSEDKDKDADGKGAPRTLSPNSPGSWRKSTGSHPPKLQAMRAHHWSSDDLMHGRTTSRLMSFPNVPSRSLRSDSGISEVTQSSIDLPPGPTRMASSPPNAISRVLAEKKKNDAKQSLEPAPISDAPEELHKEPIVEADIDLELDQELQLEDYVSKVRSQRTLTPPSRRMASVLSPALSPERTRFEQKDHQTKADPVDAAMMPVPSDKELNSIKSIDVPQDIRLCSNSTSCRPPSLAEECDSPASFRSGPNGHQTSFSEPPFTGQVSFKAESAATTQADRLVENLAQLARLHRQGELTAEEYTAAKATILKM